MSIDLSILIVNWNSRDYLRKCLHSVFTHTGGLTYEVIVIDSGSRDGCGEMLATEFPQVLFIPHEHNVGFAKANNLAAARASGDYLLLLNPDTEVTGNGILQLFEAFKQSPEGGAIGPRLLNTDGSLQMSSVQAYPSVLGHFLDSNLLRRLLPDLSLWGTAPLRSTAKRAIPAECLSGACILTPRSLYAELGGLNDRYFMYYEDMDYCLKVARSGRKVLHLPSVEIVHHGGKSSGGGAGTFSSVMMAKAGAQYFQLHHGPVQARLFRVAMGTKALLRVLMLTLVLPAALLTRHAQNVRNASRRWRSVLRWTLGKEAWAETFPQTALPATAGTTPAT